MAEAAIWLALSHLLLPESLSLRCSDDLIPILSQFHGKDCCAVSLDIKDLYYSLNEHELLRRVRAVIESQLVKFQTAAGLSASEFLRILELYLSATAVSYEGDLFVQSNGVCIGSAVAPILSEIYLNVLDVAVSTFLSSVSPVAIIVKRYVDDILILAVDPTLAENAVDVILSSSPELTFSREDPADGRLVYLDLCLHLYPSLCWSYGKPNAKPLPFKINQIGFSSIYFALSQKQILLAFCFPKLDWSSGSLEEGWVWFPHGIRQIV